MTNKSYNSLEIGSLYGIYDRSTDKIVIHLPFSTVSALLLQ
jgi:hypothetical protein